jgi:hypothetical protein
VRHLVREIVSNLVLYNLVEVLADPYTIHMIICKVKYHSTNIFIHVTGINQHHLVTIIL